MEIGKRVLYLSKSETEAKRTEKTFRKWGWSHVIVHSSYREIIKKLESNPFSYAMLVVEKAYAPQLEEKLVRSILNAHPRIPIIIRSKIGVIYDLVGRVTYLRADRNDFDDLVDVMERIYEDESLGHHSPMPAQFRKRKSKATSGPKVLPLRARD